MYCGMFCLDGEVIFIHSTQVDKTGHITLFYSSLGDNLKGTSGELAIILIRHQTIV